MHAKVYVLIMYIINKLQKAIDIKQVLLWFSNIYLVTHTYAHMHGHKYTIKLRFPFAWKDEIFLHDINRYTAPYEMSSDWSFCVKYIMDTKRIMQKPCHEGFES